MYRKQIGHRLQFQLHIQFMLRRTCLSTSLKRFYSKTETDGREVIRITNRTDHKVTKDLRRFTGSFVEPLVFILYLKLNHARQSLWQLVKYVC